MLRLFLTAIAFSAPTPRSTDSARVPSLVYYNVQPASEGKGIRKAELTMRPEVFAEQMQ